MPNGEPCASGAGDATGPIVNGMSVDVEDYFQVSAFATAVDRRDWPRFPSRVVRNTTATLDLFDEAGITATFFTLGCVAAAHPTLAREIVDRGHELASHGYEHHRVFEQSPAAFRADVERTRKTLEDVSGARVQGYRAASFSIDRRCWWAFDVLAETGHVYSSSLHPIRHDHYGAPDEPRFAFRPVDGNPLVEIPVATFELLGRRWSCAGGGFFRLLPYAWSRLGLRRLHARDGKPGIFYFHPWEIDPGQPRVPGLPARSRLRHYTNLSRMAGKLRRLMADFHWSRLDRILAGQTAGTGRAADDTRAVA